MFVVVVLPTSELQSGGAGEWRRGWSMGTVDLGSGRWDHHDAAPGRDAAARVRRARGEFVPPFLAD